MQAEHRHDKHAHKEARCSAAIINQDYHQTIQSPAQACTRGKIVPRQAHLSHGAGIAVGGGIQESRDALAVLAGYELLHHVPQPQQAGHCLQTQRCCHTQASAHGDPTCPDARSKVCCTACQPRPLRQLGCRMYTSTIAQRAQGACHLSYLDILHCANSRRCMLPEPV